MTMVKVYKVDYIYQDTIGQDNLKIFNYSCFNSKISKRKHIQFVINSIK